MFCDIWVKPGWGYVNCQTTVGTKNLASLKTIEVKIKRTYHFSVSSSKNLYYIVGIYASFIALYSTKSSADATVCQLNVHISGRHADCRKWHVCRKKGQAKCRVNQKTWIAAGIAWYCVSDCPQSENLGHIRMLQRNNKLQGTLFHRGPYSCSYARKTVILM